MVTIPGNLKAIGEKLGNMHKQSLAEGCGYTFGWWETTVNLDVSPCPKGGGYTIIVLNDTEESCHWIVKIKCAKTWIDQSVKIYLH